MIRDIVTSYNLQTALTIGSYLCQQHKPPLWALGFPQMLLTEIFKYMDKNPLKTYCLTVNHKDDDMVKF